MIKIALLSLILFFFVSGGINAQISSPTQTPSATETMTPTPTIGGSTFTHTPTAIPTFTLTPTITITPTATQTVTVTVTPTITSTSFVSPTPTPTPVLDFWTFISPSIIRTDSIYSLPISSKIYVGSYNNISLNINDVSVDIIDSYNGFSYQISSNYNVIVITLESTINVPRLVIINIFIQGYNKQLFECLEVKIGDVSQILEQLSVLNTGKRITVSPRRVLLIKDEY